MWKCPERDEAPLLRFYNSLTKQCEVFVPRRGCSVRWYSCGPTVYDSAHLGHARAYVSFDVIRRVLEDYFGYDVVYAMNITDIDDKIIGRALEQSQGDVSYACSRITTKFEREFFEDMDRLSVKRPTFVTRVTDYVSKIVDFVEVLEKKGFAYEANGSVYFDLRKYKEQWKSPVFVDCRAVNETETETEKRNRTDFVLWKKAKENEPRYESKWGPGRPGWHIECSAMATDVLGDLDIHSGGVDLAFPHHENEIAQSQAFLGTGQWTNYFLHSGHLHIEGRKMSKSLKNFVTIREALEKAGPRELRMLFLLHNWGSDSEFSEESLEYARKVEQKVVNFISFCESSAEAPVVLSPGDREAMEFLEKTKTDVHAALCNNVDTQKTVLLLLNLISQLYKTTDRIGDAVLRAAGAYVRRISEVFGLLAKRNETDRGSEIADILCRFRARVRRAAKEKGHPELYGICDEIREELKEAGYLIEDSGKESLVRRAI